MTFEKLFLKVTLGLLGILISINMAISGWGLLYLINLGEKVSGLDAKVQVLFDDRNYGHDGTFGNHAQTEKK